MLVLLAYYGGYRIVALRPVCECVFSVVVGGMNDMRPHGGSEHDRLLPIDEVELWLTLGGGVYRYFKL